MKLSAERHPSEIRNADEEPEGKPIRRVEGAGKRNGRSNGASRNEIRGEEGRDEPWDGRGGERDNLESRGERRGRFPKDCIL